MFLRPHAKAEKSRARISQKIFRGFGLLVLPFALGLALTAATPAPALADTPTGEGVFDCLGEYDWGCKIVSFMFDPEGANNSVYYFKDGSTVVDQPSVIEMGFRMMLGFFSNAMLIIASLLLLYHLIVMVAETAHTGKIGGKEANQLWAPIRLVVAIGLLVPLSNDTGLNSGQYIVMQIAKWGSGLASQTWKLFAEGLVTDGKMPGPPVPRVYELGLNTISSYVCMELANYYNRKPGVPDSDNPDIIEDPQGSILDPGGKEFFKNELYANVCGTIQHKVQEDAPAAPGKSDYDAEIIRHLIELNDQSFEKGREKLKPFARILAKYFRSSYTGELPNSTELKKVLAEFQQGFIDALKGKTPNQKYKNIVTEIQKAAETQGWASAGAWFFAVTRAQGALVTGGTTIPEASGPEEVLVRYPDEIGASYQNYLDWLAKSPELAVPKEPIYDKDKGMTFSPSEEAGQTMENLRNTGKATIDELFKLLDRFASYVGLWEEGPVRAFGDLGASKNPFGEIANFGQRKIRLGLDYLGLALLGHTGAGLLQSALGWMSDTRHPFSKSVTSFVSKFGAAAVAIIMIVATLFLLAGIVLGFIVPLFPFSRFFFAILTWIGTIIEAMICIPFFALAHLTPKGEGFAGPNAKTGYYLIFQIFIRPVLIIFGLVAAMIMFYVAAKFLNAMFYEATAGINAYSGDAMLFVQKLIYSLIYAALIYLIANMTTKMMDHIPKQALRWMGTSAPEESYEGQDTFVTLAGVLGGQQIMNNFTSLPEKVSAVVTQPAQGLGDAAAGRRSSRTRDRQHGETLGVLGRGGRGGTAGGAAPPPFGPPPGPTPRTPRGGGSTPGSNTPPPPPRGSSP